MNRKAMIAGLKAEIAELAAKATAEGADEALKDEAAADIEAKSAEVARLEAEDAEQAKRDATLAKGLKFLEAQREAAKASETAAAATPGTPGEVFVKSDAYRSLMDQYPQGIPAKTRVHMGSVNIGGVKALLTNPHLSPAQHVIAPAQLAVTGLSQAITVIDDAPEAVKIFRATFTSAADVVDEGDPKPEASLVWASDTVNLGTVAHHMPVTNQALSHNSMLRNLIDTFLVNGVRAKVEGNVASMLASASGLGTQSFDTDLRTTLRRAITKAQNAGASIGSVPTGILISANDAETLDLEQIDNLVLAPGQAPQQVNGIWRTPLVVSPQIADGFAYVGDLRQIVLYTSGGVSVTTGWVDDQFTRNELTILAETEAVSTVIVGPAIVKADLTA